VQECIEKNDKYSVNSVISWQRSSVVTIIVQKTQVEKVWWKKWIFLL